ncbi:IPPc [Musa troglodytarum]|uniref:IPPc n=1 Tax=Musa troglodytarum TaxID=320322 RepID=A0A9E7G1D2_9LILI|nr:IPPc [Musa troglodytarum]
MDERKEEEKEAEAEAAGRSSAPQRKGKSYSQPLSRDAVLSTSARRKHSLDDDTLSSPSDNAAAAPRALSCGHYNSSSPPSHHHRHKHSSSVEEIRFPLSQQLPPSVPSPPHHHHQHAPTAPVSFGNPFSIDYHRGGSSLSDSDGSLTLERVMSEYGGTPGTIPEFMGNGGGVGIFRVPHRSAMHPDRPPALEVRPHPLRETQAGSFLRTIACTNWQLWAGQESGLRVWNRKDVFESWGPGVMVKRGDEKSAPFSESCRTSPTLCLVVDGANGLIWSGHKDGKIRSWKMDQPTSANSSLDDGGCASAIGGAPPFREGLSWPAHQRSPVLSMVVTSYGEIWSGSEGGVIRAWPWDAIEKALSLSVEERHMAALLVERDSRTRDLLKVFGIDGQRSRNALIGAADAVRRAAVKGTFGDDNRRTEALAISMDGIIWTGCTNGSVGLEGSANGQWWLGTIGKTLDEGTSFQRVGSRQLAGARKSLRPYIGDVDAAAVPCGFGRAIGNKLAGGMLTLIMFIEQWLSAGQPQDFMEPQVTGSQPDDGRPELSEADMVVFLGDFNYRLHSITYDEARDMVSQRCFDWLREKDQLRAEMKAGYDSSEKKRIPAWFNQQSAYSNLGKR